MSEPRLCGAGDLRTAFETAERWLAANRDGINAINVYPVPDGDTGTNMLLTLRAAIRGGEGDHLGACARSMARAALLGARGNSGVILSQMLRGFAEALAEVDEASAEVVVGAWVRASEVAYASVSQPVEGTMLTVLREAAAAARDRLADTGSTAVALSTLAAAAYASLERTPELLPRLKEAGVVDAGGAGIAVIIEGFTCALGGTDLPPSPRFAGQAGAMAAGVVEHEGHGYCTEYLVHGGSLDRQALEAALLEVGGESILVVGDDRTVHVHVHVPDPGPALSVGARAGALTEVKVDNMQAQHESWRAEQERDLSATARELPRLGMVAVTRGPGLSAAFRSLGASVVVELRDGAKASAGELLEAARRAGTNHAILLPNDGDLMMAAEAAEREAAGFLTVVPSRNVAAGLSAAIYYHPQGETSEVAEEMLEALTQVRCVEVSIAVRDASVDQVDVREGEAIAFVDGTLRAARPTLDEAFMAALAEAVTETTEVVTVYLGAQATRDDGDRLQRLITEAHPHVEVELMIGGQPHYPYIAAIE